MATPNLRPTFNRLPIKGYQDNPIADALTKFYDSKLVAVGTQVEQLYSRIDPATCPDQYLDWLAFMVGMIEPYYSLGWSVAVKRKAVAWANLIFTNRGTTFGLQTALDVHSIKYDIYSSDDLRLPFTFNGAATRFGLISSQVYVRLPLLYPRGGYEFREAQRAVLNYTALVTPTRATYNKFYIGFSVFDDPIF